jgi:hypothetical protein
MDQDLCEFTRREDELWYQVNIVVPVPAELCGYGFVRAEFAVELGERGRRGAVVIDRWDWADGGGFWSYLGEVEGCAVTAVVVVLVHMKDLLPVNR